MQKKKKPTLLYVILGEPRTAESKYLTLTYNDRFMMTTKSEISGKT